VATLTVSDPTGLKSYSNEKVFSVYPNPSVGSVHVRVSDQNLINQKYLITDLAGKELVCGILTASDTEVATVDLAAGVYILNIGNVKERLVILGKQD
jgi:hypothetical protein